MRELRFAWLWMIAGWILIGLAIAASLAPLDGRPGLGISDKLLHAAGYCGLMIWFGGIYRPARYPIVAGALFVLGIALEFAQQATGVRFFELGDMVANGVGVLVGWMLAAALLGPWCQLVEKWALPARAP